MATTAQSKATDLDTLCINTIRTLSIDAIQKANSGHPGTPMAMAPVAYTLWQRFLRFDPADPIWPNRDRFVLSAGHASMLLYSLLHLTKAQAVDPEYETLGEPSVSLDDIKSFRQLGSKAAGHPEYHLTSGVETTTGPLGQGIATSVGMAIGGKWLRAHFGAELFDFDVYAICGDGDLMEGVSGEAGSIAGHQRLDNLCWIYDNNHISIDGRTELAYSDDVAARFVGYGWNVTRVGDANDLELLTPGVRGLQAGGGTADADHRRQPHRLRIAAQAGHARGPRGAAGQDEVRETKRAYDWPEDAEFLIPDGVYEHFADGIGARGRKLRGEWEQRVATATRSSPRRSTRCNAGSCRRAGTPRSPASRPIPAGSRPERRPARC